MKILLLGANGYLGARLFVDLKDKFEVIGTYNKHQLFPELIQLDITDEKKVKEIFETYKPAIVIHPANHASPRPAADDPVGYRMLNRLSTEFIQKAADRIGSKLIFISSLAALNPDNVYGELKLQSEQVVKQTKAGYLILRPSLILGLSPNTTNDRPFNRVLKCMSSNTMCEFDTSWKFQPTYIGHLSDVVTAAIEKNVFNKTIPVCCSSIQTQFSTAIDILRPYGIEVKPIDKKMSMAIQEINESELRALGVPTCSYEEMIDKIHEELKSFKT